jgi:hypothetical protein
MTVDKHMYLAKRHPEFTREQYRMRWRQHGAYALSFLTEVIVRYSHTDPLPFTGGLAGASDEYDGVGIVWFGSTDVRHAGWPSQDDMDLIRADEVKTFSEVVTNFEASTTEHVLRDGEREVGIKLMRFFTRRPEMTKAQFLDYWLNDHGPALLDSPLSGYIRRYVQNHPNDPAIDGRQRWGLDYDGIEETWFDSIASLAEATALPAWRTVIDEDQARFTESSIVYLGHEHLMYFPADPSKLTGKLPDVTRP